MHADAAPAVTLKRPCEEDAKNDVNSEQRVEVSCASYFIFVCSHGGCGPPKWKYVAFWIDVKFVGRPGRAYDLFCSPKTHSTALIYGLKQSEIDITLV